MGEIVILARYRVHFVLSSMKIWCKIQVIINPFCMETDVFLLCNSQEKGTKEISGEKDTIKSVSIIFVLY